MLFFNGILQHWSTVSVVYPDAEPGSGFRNVVNSLLKDLKFNKFWILDPDKGPDLRLIMLLFVKKGFKTLFDLNYF